MRHLNPSLPSQIASLTLLASSLALAAPPPSPPAPTTAPTTPHSLVGERIPSEDPAIKDFHSLGVINGQANLFRSASPVRDIVKKGAAPVDAAAIAEADARMKRLASLGIRTIIDLETPDPASIKTNSASQVAAKLQWLSLERDAAARAGITLLYHPIENKGENSIKTMSDADVQKLLDNVTDDIFSHAKSGGVLFHCSAGHDRTGITTAYIRIKYQHWPVDEAIAEMRRLGHNWPKYSNNGGLSSWDEDHLRAIAQTLPPNP